MIEKERMKRILMIAFHFPPIKVSSSVQRVLKFSSYLLENGWQAIILTVKPGASSSVSDEQLDEIPDQIVVKRCTTLDTSRHLSVRGKYFSWMALPDRWWTWIISGSFSGFRLIKRYKPDIIWSTYPITSACFIALILSRLFKIPWVADLRDPIYDNWFPTLKSQRKIYIYLDKKLVKYASKVIFTSPGTLKLYQSRYPEQQQNKWILIRNGYDEQNFIDALKYNQSERTETALSKLTLLHSGIIYPDDRDPSSFFDVLVLLKNELSGTINEANFQLILRATGHDELIEKMVNSRGLQDIIKIKPSIPYTQALAEMLNVDGLIVIQGCSCNHQTPAKIYEYLRAQKPILLLADKASDSYKILNEIDQAKYTAELNNIVEIEKTLIRYIKAIENKTDPICNKSYFQFSRQEQTAKFSGVLNHLLEENR